MLEKRSPLGDFSTLNIDFVYVMYTIAKKSRRGCGVTNK